MRTKANRALDPRVLSALGLGLLMLSNSSFAACLLKPRQVDPIGTVYTVMVAPEREVAQYVALGFSRVACPADMSVVRQYVERGLCDGTGPGPVRPINTDALIGRPRAVACASARAGLAEAGR